MAMMITRLCLIAALQLLAVQGTETLKVAGVIQNSGTGAKGKAAFDMWATWANSADSGLDYKVEIAWVDQTTALDYGATLATADFTAAHVLIAPYGSSFTTTFLSESKKLSITKPILVWGGASDSIFTTDCTGLNCFGTLTLASSYTTPSLDAIKAVATAGFKVAGITNSNTFSKSVHAGTKTWCTTNNVTLAKEVELSVAKSSLVQADKTAIDELAAMNPDVVTIAGHPGDVEEVIMQLQSHATFKAKAIIATNAWSAGTAKYDAGNKTKQLVGVIMPDQWAEDATMTDTITKWTTASFKEKAGLAGITPVTYHAAAAAGAATAVLHAMAAGTAGTRVSTLVANMKAVDTPSMYGTLSFNTDGSIKSKPMYGRQKLASGATAVLPPNVNLVYPMPESESTGGGNNTNNTTTNTTNPTTPPAATGGGNNTTNTTTKPVVSGSSPAALFSALPLVLVVLLAISA